MNILTKYTSRDYLRNGKLNINGGGVSTTVSYGGGSGISLSGNYLPATANSDGTYTVDLTKVTFNGDVISTGEITAYGSGSSSATTGTSTSGSVTIYDGLDSDSALIALSANQGRVLKELIDSIASGDTSGNTSINIVIDSDSLADNQILVYNAANGQWENQTNEGISEISKLKDVSLSTLSDNQILQYDSTSSKWVNKDFNTEVSALTEHLNDTVIHITDDERNSWNSAVTSSHTHTNKTVLDGITSTKVSNWDGVVTNWNKAFYFDSNGNLRVKLNLIGDEEISAYGSGTSTSTGAITIVDSLNSTLTDAALSANQGRVLKDLIDTIDMGDFDLSGYSLTSHTHSNYSLTSHTHSDYSLTGHTHNLEDLTSSAHTHNYASTVKLGTTSYSVTDNIISLPAYPTLSTLGAASSTDFANHTANTTSHITATERTNWNKAYTNNHTHSNKTALDTITATKINNWDSVYDDWNDVFEIDSNGNLKVKVNVIGSGEISAYGSGTSTSSGAITIVDNLTSTLTDAALSANQGRVLKDLIDSANFGEFDLSGYSLTSHTHSNYSLTSHTHSAYASSSHTHPISAITSLQSTLDGKSSTSHTHSNYSTTSHTHSNYSLTSHTHSYVPLSGATMTGALEATALVASTGYITVEKGWVQTKLANTGLYNVAGDARWYYHSGQTAWVSDKPIKVYQNSNYYTVLHTGNSGHTHSSLTFSGGTFSAKTYNPSGATTVYIPTNTTHLTNGSGYITTAATVAAANKVANTLSFSAGTFSANSFNGSAAKTVYVPTNTTHLTNGSGYITTAATVAAANKVTSTLTFTTGTTSTGTFNGSAAVTIKIPSNTTHLTNGSGYITTAATTAAAVKLSTARTLWGQSFNGTANVSGNMTGVGSISASGAISCASLTASGEVTAYSDKRLKDNIQPLTNRGYVTPHTYIKDGKESIGFIAQDMQEKYPELVTVDDSSDEKYLSVNYMQYTAVLQAQIIELSKEIQELKQKLNDIYNKDN